MRWKRFKWSEEACFLFCCSVGFIDDSLKIFIGLLVLKIFKKLNFGIYSLKEFNR